MQRLRRHETWPR